MAGEQAIGGAGLFGEDFHLGEVRGEAGAAELVALLELVALGDEDAAVARGESGERGGNAGEKLDLLVGDGLGEAGDAGSFLGGDGAIGELLEASDQGFAEAFEAIAMSFDGGALNMVEALADFFGGVNAVVEVRDEGGDGALEVDVVLPQSVVGVEEEGLAGGRARFWLGTHRVDYMERAGRRTTLVALTLGGIPRSL